MIIYLIGKQTITEEVFYFSYDNFNYMVNSDMTHVFLLMSTRVWVVPTYTCTRLSDG
jgi:hypothetical protein